MVCRDCLFGHAGEGRGHAQEGVDNGGIEVRGLAADDEFDGIVMRHRWAIQRPAW